MSKRARRRRAGRKKGQASPNVLRQQGAAAFKRGDYEMAIAAWRRISRAQRDADLTAAFAEACFRRGLGGHLDSLRQAANLAAGEPRYLYHLALTHHRAGGLKKAEPLYRRTLALIGAGDGIGPRAAYALGLLLLETGRRPTHDPLWKQWQKNTAEPAWVESCRRLTWAEHLAWGRPAPGGLAPDPLWENIAARSGGQKDPTPVDLANLAGTAAAVAHFHLGARAWDRDDAQEAFVHWRAAHEAGLALPQLEHNLFAAARTVATERLRAGDVPATLEAATLGLAVAPDDNGLQTIARQAHFRLGHAAATAGRWDQAYRHWENALQVGGKRSRRLVINLALAQEQRENWREAADLWREALRRRPRKADHPDALDNAQVARLWRHVSESYRRSGWTDEALNTFRNALKWAPEDVKLRTAYVDFLMDDGRLTAADNQLDILLEARPNDVELLERRAQLYVAFYPYAAVNVWKRILELQPDHPNAAQQMARHYERLGDNAYHWNRLEQALHFYQEGLSYAPDDGMLLASIGMCHLDRKEKRAAQEFFDRACAAEPTNPAVYQTIVNSWLDHRNKPAAQAVIQRARETYELSAKFFLDLADFGYTRGFRDWAREYVAEARVLATHETKTLLMIADLVGRNGDYALAQEITEEVIKREPDNPMAYALKGLAQALQGDLGAARRSWNRAEKIAEKTHDELALLAVAEMRMLGDPDYMPPLSSLARILSHALFENDAGLDDEEWF